MLFDLFELERQNMPLPLSVAVYGAGLDKTLEIFLGFSFFRFLFFIGF